MDDMNSNITQTDGQIVGREEPSVAVEVRGRVGNFNLRITFPETSVS